MSRVLAVVPTYNSRATLGRAVDSLLRQTLPTDVVVVDDCSTDGSAEWVEKTYASAPVVLVRVKQNSGPAIARNVGIDWARTKRYEFVCFLDADDEVAPTKVEKQVAALDLAPGAGWVYCDVMIHDAQLRRSQLASDKYGYALRALTGDLHGQLSAGNFIPVHAPLLRLAAAEGLTFPVGAVTEDWDFWVNLSARSTAVYVDEVLATYHKSRTGRSATVRRPPIPDAVRALPDQGQIVPPLRLNLGCGTPGRPSWHPLPGMVNLDKSLGWAYEDGLGQFSDGTVHGITISHSLMYVPKSLWPFVFGELHRVLVRRHEHNEPAGVLRVTEDDCFHPQSSRRGGWRGSESAVELTSARLVLEAMRRAGFKVYREVGPYETSFMDDSLCQRYHGNPPHVFFVEGIKE